jgi:hypothetical protein
MNQQELDRVIGVLKQATDAYNAIVIAHDMPNLIMDYPPLVDILTDDQEYELVLDEERRQLEYELADAARASRRAWAEAKWGKQD